MTCGLPSLDGLRPNPDWTKLPLFDRKGWKRVRFGEVVENLNETERNPAEVGIERFIGLEHLDPGSLHVRAWGNVEDGTTFTRRCRPGQVLFGKRRAYQRKVAAAEFDAVVSGDIYELAPKNDRLLPELLPFLCMSERFFQHAVGTSAGSLSPRTNWSSPASFEFDLPPLDQQRRIAEILMAVDENLLVTKECQTATEKYRNSFLGDSLDSLPEECIRFHNVQELVIAGVIEPPQDGNHGELHPTVKDFVEDGIPFIMANDIRDGLLCLDTCKRITEMQAQRLRIGFARSGDILLTHKGTVGLTTVVPSGVGKFIMFLPQVTYYRVKDSTRLRPDFLSAVFTSEQFQSVLGIRAKQSTRDYIGILAQRALPIVVPDMTVQNRIVEKLNGIDGAIAGLKTKALALLTLIGTLTNTSCS
jgi:type I restriction enzyme S subunit